MFPNTRYAKMVAKQTGEIFAYFERCDDYEISEAMQLWITSVFDTWTIPDHEFETYAQAFEVAPIITMDDLGVIAFGQAFRHAGSNDDENLRGPSWVTLPGTEPWYFEAKRK